MHVAWNYRGDRLLGLRRRLPPVLYKIESPIALAQFDHPGYYNSCTMKSCCFGGEDDTLVMSGSDDFNVYAWCVPEEGGGGWVGKAQHVLQGHRSIVNQVLHLLQCIIGNQLHPMSGEVQPWQSCDSHIWGGEGCEAVEYIASASGQEWLQGIRKGQAS